MPVFKFDYEFVQEAYGHLLATTPAFAIITGTKLIAVGLLLVTWYNKFFNSMDKDMEKEYKKPPISPTDIFNGIVIVTLVGAFDQILNALDLVLGGIENQYAILRPTIKSYQIGDTNVTDMEDSSDWMGMMKMMGEHVVTFLKDPMYLILKVLEGFFWLIDLLIYGIYLCDRFFYLWLLRVLGPLALAAFVVEKLQKWWWAWIGLYVAAYLLIIPYFVINAFTNILYDYSHSKITAGIGQFTGDSTPMIIVLIFVSLVKFKLFRTSKDIVFKIFS